VTHLHNISATGLVNACSEGTFQDTGRGVAISVTSRCRRAAGSGNSETDDSRVFLDQL
jgi:hypothetical protein